MTAHIKSKRGVSQRRRVALIIESSNTYARQIIHGIRNYSRENRLWSIFFQEHQRGNPDLSWLERWEGDGILARIENEAVARIIKSRGLPTVDLSSFRLLPDIPYVETNDKAFAKLAADHLILRNFKQFAFCGDSRYNWSKQREQYFAAHIKKHGYECHVFDSNVYHQRFLDIRREMIEWVKALPKPIGIMACFDNQGQELLEACRVSNISVPFSVAVIGCDNDEMICDLAEPPMSSVIPNAVKTGYFAASLLDRMMNGETIALLEHLQGPIGIKTRQSTDVFATGDPLVIAALDYINKNACSGIQVQDVLEQFFVSRRSFEARFKKNVGKTPHDVIQEVKIKYAKQLLEETDLTIEEISSRTGFLYSEYFCVAFKRNTSMLPSEYRKINNPG